MKKRKITIYGLDLNSKQEVEYTYIATNELRAMEYLKYELQLTTKEAKDIRIYKTKYGYGMDFLDKSYWVKVLMENKNYNSLEIQTEYSDKIKHIKNVIEGLEKWYEDKYFNREITATDENFYQHQYQELKTIKQELFDEFDYKYKQQLS